MQPISSLNENAQKWVRALRSGLFQQGRQYLRQEAEKAGTENPPDLFCCLGVACELAIIDGVEIRKDNKMGGHTMYDNSSGSLPTAVMDWLGLTDSDGGFAGDLFFTDDGKNDDGKKLYASNLADLNDTVKADFNKIADFIESMPIGLFRRDDEQ